MSSRGATFARVLRNRDLRRIQLALVGSEIGYWGFTVAFAVWAFAEGGAAFVGIAAFVRMVPGAIAGPFAGALADRHSRRKVMVVSNLVRALTLAIAATAIVIDIPVAVLAAVGLNSAAATGFRPAMAALLPELTSHPAELTAANVVAGAIDSSAIFLGPALGGLALLAVSPEAVFVIAGASTVISALLITRVSGERPRPARAHGDDGGLITAVRDGLSAVREQPSTKIVLVALTGQAMVWGVCTVMMTIVALETLGREEAWVGYLSAALGVGCLAGTASAAGLVGGNRLGTALSIALAWSSAPLIILGIVPGAVSALILFGLIGMAQTMVEVTGMTLLQRTAPDEILARVFGLLEAIVYGSIAIGALAAPLAVKLVGTEGALIVLGTTLPVLALVTWSTITALDRLEPSGDPGMLRLLKGSAIFAELPQATLERLAGAAVTLQVPAGQAVFEQDDPGDRYYLIAEGTATASVDGLSVRALGPGDGFGEIALLNDSPRTAQIRADSELSLYALAREDFLGVLSGNPASAHAAAGIAASRLATAAPARMMR